jgi:hypothetical protein
LPLVAMGSPRLCNLRISSIPLIWELGRLRWLRNRLLPLQTSTIMNPREIAFIDNNHRATGFWTKAGKEIALMTKMEPAAYRSRPIGKFRWFMIIKEPSTSK